MNKKALCMVLSCALLSQGITVSAKDGETQITTEITTESNGDLNSQLQQQLNNQSNNSADNKTSSKNSSANSSTIDTTTLNDMMDQMNSQYKNDGKTYTTDDLTKMGGNHGGTTMTLADYQNMINQNSSDFSSASNDDIFNMMKNSIDKGEDVNLSDAFSSSTGLDIPSNFMYDLTDCGIDGTLDASNLNLQYGSLLSSLSDTYSDSINDLSKNTMSATDLFNNTYGDLADKLQTSEATLPDGFSFSDISSQNKSAIDSAYSSAFSNSDYNSIKDKVSTRDVFDEASQGLSAPGLTSLDDLSKLTSDYNSQLENNWNSEKAKSQSDNWSNYNKYKTDANNSNNSKENDVNNDKNNIKNEIDNTNSDMNNKRSKAESTKGNFVGKKLDEWGAYDWIDDINFNKNQNNSSSNNKSSSSPKDTINQKKEERKQLHNNKL